MSIPSNIAEGYDRQGDNEFRRFLYIAKGSCAELKTQIYIARAINLIPKVDADMILQECDKLGRTIGGLIQSIKDKKAVEDSEDGSLDTRNS